MPPPAIAPKHSVIGYGCRGDGTTNDAEALQRALDARPGRLHLPAGRYLIGRTLRIHSGTELLADPEAVVILAAGATTREGEYLLTNSSEESGSRDIRIEGGTWDGNNAGNPRPAGFFDPGHSGSLFHFQNVVHLSLQNLHLRNAEAYHARFTQVSHFQIESIRFSADKIRPNNDGIHLGGNCQNGVIRDIKGLHPGVTGDDMVALNADDALTRTEVRGMTCGPIRNVLIEDVQAEGCHSFVRLLSVWSPIENVTIRKVRGTCGIAAINCDAARGCRVPVFDEKHPPFPDGVGFLRNISASDFVVAKSKKNAIPLLRLETRMENMQISNFHRAVEKDSSPETPTLAIRHVAVEDLQLNGEPSTALLFGDAFCSNAPSIGPLLINPAR